MTTKIYDQHRAAFANVSAYVITRGKERIASVAFKFPRDGAGRLYAYVRFFGMPMVRGYVGGYGYDKCTAAVEDAIKKIDPLYFTDDHWKASKKQCMKFVATIEDSKDGTHWEDSFRNAGYTVLQAV